MDSKDFARALLSNQGKIAALLGAVLTGLEGANHAAQGGNSTPHLDEVKSAKDAVADFLAENEEYLAALEDAPSEEGEEEASPEEEPGEGKEAAA